MRHNITKITNLSHSWTEKKNIFSNPLFSPPHPYLQTIWRESNQITSKKLKKFKYHATLDILGFASANSVWNKIQCFLNENYIVT